MVYMVQYEVIESREEYEEKHSNCDRRACWCW